MSKFLFFILSITTTQCFAIDYYGPGDTLWVWTQSSLNIREKPDPNSKILGKVLRGEQVVTLDYQDQHVPYAVEAIKPSLSNPGDTEKPLPNLLITGFWAKIQYKGLTGFVFDGYLSRLPPMMGHQSDSYGKEDFHVAALKKRFKLLQQIGENTYDQQDHKFVRYIFEGGYMIDISGGPGSWGKEMLFPDNLSLLEGYLMYALTMREHVSRLLEKGEDYLIFEIETGTLTIKKAGSFLVIYEEHAC